MRPSAESAPNHLRRWGSAGSAFLVGALLIGGCVRKLDPGLVYGRGYKALMIRWETEVKRRSQTADQRFVQVPRGERFAHLLRDKDAEIALHEGTLAELDRLGPPPAWGRDLVGTSRTMLAFFASSAHAERAALSRRDRKELARLSAKFDQEASRLLRALFRSRNSLARRTGQPEKTLGEIAGEGTR